MSVQRTYRNWDRSLLRQQLKFFSTQHFFEKNKKAERIKDNKRDKLHNTGITQFSACSIVFLCTLHYAGVAALTLAGCGQIPTQRISIQRSLTSRKNPKPPTLLLLIYHHTAFQKRIFPYSPLGTSMSLFPSTGQCSAEEWPSMARPISRDAQAVPPSRPKSRTWRRQINRIFTAYPTATIKYFPFSFPAASNERQPGMMIW